LRLGLSLGGYYTNVKNYVDCAARAESQGLDSLWVPDSQMIHRDVYECMALCAAKTERIRLGTGVTNPVTRDVTVSACAINTLNEISNGRALFGLGTGDSSVRRIGVPPMSTSKLTSYVKTLRDLCDGKAILLPNGENVSMRWSHRKVSIYLAATGEKMLELAGKIGDGVIINVGTGDAALKQALENLRNGQNSRTLSRDPVISDLSFVCLAENRNDAIRAAKPYVLWYYRNARRLFEINSISLARLDSEFEQIDQKYVAQDHIHTDDWTAALSESSSISDEMVDKFVIAGTPEDCVRKLKQKETFGVELFIARHTGDETDWQDFFASYCENVLPNLR
jgi:5,10-methylenetetrahydromethanopterin reductase